MSDTTTFDLGGHVARREHEVFTDVTREWPDWQECQHGKHCVEVMAHWSDTAPFTVTTGHVNHTQRFPRTVHSDGTASPDLDPWNGKPSTHEFTTHSKCPDCGGLDTLTTEQQAWGDQTTCKTDGCDYRSYYSIGD